MVALLYVGSNRSGHPDDMRVVAETLPESYLRLRSSKAPHRAVINKAIYHYHHKDTSQYLLLIYVTQK